MRSIVFVLLGLGTLAPCAGQTVDGPVVFGKVRHLSIGPDSSIWLTTRTGNVYSTQGIDSLWKEGLQTNPGVSYAGLSTCFDRIIFFSKDTAILFGNIRCQPDSYGSNCILRTVDGGLSWSPIQFEDKSTWVRDGQILGAGKARISASNGRIYRTIDHGATWVMLPRIFRKERKAYYRRPDLWSFHYQNDSVAIATNRSNHLAVTSSNFTSIERIPSPLDQGSFERVHEPYYLNGTGRKFVANWEIDKVRIFGDHYVVMQNGSMYHSERDKILWKKFEAEVLDFEIDPDSGRLYAITAEKGPGQVGMDWGFTAWGEVNSGVKPLSMQVLGGRIYLLFAEYRDVVGKDIIREQVAGLTITEKNYKSVNGYYVFVVGPDGTKLSSVIAE